MARYNAGNMSIYVLLVASFITSHLYSEVHGFKYHDFCATPPQDMKTRFPLYSLEVDTKTNGIPWAYRQNNTITVSVKAMYLKYKIRQIFISVPAMTVGTPEVPAKRIHRGEWKWDMRGGVIPIDCTNPAGGFSGGGSNAVRNFWWIKDGFYNVTAEWDPLNTISNAYNVDIIQFEVYVSPDREEPDMPTGTFGPAQAPSRWVKLTSEEFINLDYIDLHRYIRTVYGPYMDPFRSAFGVDNSEV